MTEVKSLEFKVKSYTLEDKSLLGFFILNFSFLTFHLREVLC